MKIVFKNETGGYSIITPSPEILEQFSIETVAQYDVPKGVSYKFVEDSDVTFKNINERDSYRLPNDVIMDGVAHGRS